MPAKKQNQQKAFAVRDCSLVVMATGVRALDLGDLRDGLLTAEEASIYHHFWGRLLQPSFDEPEFSNDFASWAHHALRDTALAEQLSVIDPTRFDSLETLRQELVEIVEMRFDEHVIQPWAERDSQFHFLKSKIVVFDTGVRLDTPSKLPDAVGEMSAGSVFYHFIDARRRTNSSHDDFSEWLSGSGKEFETVAHELAAIDPYFSSLARLKNKLVSILSAHLKKS